MEQTQALPTDRMWDERKSGLSLCMPSGSGVCEDGRGLAGGGPGEACGLRRERSGTQVQSSGKSQSQSPIWESLGASQVVLVVKNLPANAGDTRASGSIPGSGRSPGGGHDYLLQYSCLENSMDRGTWQATVHEIVNSWKTTEET